MTPSQNRYQYLILDGTGRASAQYNKVSKKTGKIVPYKSIIECITYSKPYYTVVKRWVKYGVSTYTPLAKWDHSQAYEAGPIFKTFEEAKGYIHIYSVKITALDRLCNPAYNDMV